MLAAAWAGPARASQRRASLEVAVPGNAVGAIVAAVGEGGVTLTVDDTLDATKIRIGNAVVDVAGSILLKGKGATRARFLDDPRNAPKLGGTVRDALKKAAPGSAARFEQNHRAWSRAIVRKILDWQKALAKSPVAGKKVKDPYGRRYLLEWAGADVTPGGIAPPASLAKAPAQPKQPSAAAYQAYVDALVRALL